jgi:hypothetical protein
MLEQKELVAMSVEQLRDKFCEVTGETPEVALSIKGKKNLVDKILDYQQATELLERLGMPVAEPLEEAPFVQNTPVEVSTEIPPTPGSDRWQDYVIGKLNKDEVDVKDGKSHPKAAGLRRVSQLLLGPIVKSGPVQVFPPSGPKNNTTVVYEVVFEILRGDTGAWVPQSNLLEKEYRTFSEIADANTDNTPHPYNQHLSATAATRAEGRALRKALGLNCATAEEMNTMSAQDKGNGIIQLPVTDENKPIQPVQKAAIANIAKKLKIDVTKALEFSGLGASVDALSAIQAATFLTTLVKYQANSSDSLEVPEMLKLKV